MKTKKKTERHALNIGLVGAGALGNALAQRLYHTGFKVHAIVSRSGRSARRLASKIKCEKAGNDFKSLEVCDLIFITVPDSQIHRVEKKLINISFHAKKVMAVHTSGTLTSGSLNRLKQISRNTVSTASMHPMQTFPKGMLWNKQTLTDLFMNIYFGIEGDAVALKMIRNIAKVIGARTIVIPKNMKSLYHMGGVFSSNFLIALLYLTEKMYAQVGLTEKETIHVLYPILARTLENLKTLSITASLTGPAVRNDLTILRRHRQALQGLSRRHRTVYKELSSVCFEIAKNREHS